jgi:hypothetical protein
MKKVTVKGLIDMLCSYTKKDKSFGMHKVVLDLGPTIGYVNIRGISYSTPNSLELLSIVADRFNKKINLTEGELMAREWLNDPHLKDMRGGFTEQVIRTLLAEINNLKKKEDNK